MFYALRHERHGLLLLNIAIGMPCERRAFRMRGAVKALSRVRTENRFPLFLDAL
jgi:hypothetical protein